MGRQMKLRLDSEQPAKPSRQFIMADEPNLNTLNSIAFRLRKAAKNGLQSRCWSLYNIIGIDQYDYEEEVYAHKDALLRLAELLERKSADINEMDTEFAIVRPHGDGRKYPDVVTTTDSKAGAFYLADKKGFDVYERNVTAWEKVDA